MRPGQDAGDSHGDARGDLMIVNSIPMPVGTQKCLICDAPLSLHQARRSKLCGRGECDWRYSLLRQQNKLCKICGRPLSDRELPAKVCAALECQHAAIADIARQERERNEARYRALSKQAAQLRDRAVNSFGIQEPESFPLAVIPASVVKIAHLPENRRREFRDYLTQLINQAVTSPNPPSTASDQTPPAVQDPRVLAVLAKGCACCKGSCCQGGGYAHAYLTLETIRRYMATRPDQRPRDVLAAYLSHLGNQTYARSCVYHQADGCSLPREMRADICNRFFCGGLLELQQKLPPMGPFRGFFVAAADGVIQRAAFIHEDQMLIIQSPQADPD